MTTKTLRTIGILLIMVVAFITGIILTVKFINKPISNSTNQVVNTETDTIISKTVLKKLKPYNTETKPKVVTIYKTSYVKPDTVYLKGDTVVIAVPGSTINYNSSFLTNFQDASKLIDFKLKGESLSLSLLTPKGISQTQLFNIDPLHYNYIYTDNKLTIEPNNKWYNNFTIYGQLLMKPLVNIYEIDLGLNYKTSIIIIDGGISFYFIPEFKQKFNLTPYIGIRYNLPWPQRK